MTGEGATVDQIRCQTFVLTSLVSLSSSAQVFYISRISVLTFSLLSVTYGPTCQIP